MFAVRIIISTGIATVVVLIMTIVGLSLFGAFDKDQGREIELHPLQLLTESQRIDFAEELGLDTRPRRPELPAMEDIPPFEVPRRHVSGFVQVEVEYDSEGKVTDARILDAAPRGIYEQQALEQVRSRRYTPDSVNGRAIPGSRVEIVDFTIPPSEE